MNDRTDSPCVEVEQVANGLGRERASHILRRMLRPCGFDALNEAIHLPIGERRAFVRSLRPAELRVRHDAIRLGHLRIVHPINLEGRRLTTRIAERLAHETPEPTQYLW